MTTPTKPVTVEDVQILDVTPDMAREWLENNEVNRNIRRKLVDAYRRDMEAGRWAFTAEPVQISRSGRLLNGQHRLSALSEAKGIDSLRMVVATGLADQAQQLMDQGTSRNTRDALIMEHGHVKNVALVASLCRWLAAAPDLDPKLSANALRFKITAAEQIEVYRNHREVIDHVVSRANHFREHIPGSPTAIAYAYYHMMQVDGSAAEEFFAGMLDMEWAWKNDPRKAALRRLQVMFREEPTSMETGIMLVSVLSRAWNAWRKQEEVETILVRSRAGIIPPAKLI